MDEKKSYLYGALVNSNAEFSIARGSNRSPDTYDLDHVIREIIEALKAGRLVHPPSPVMVGGLFDGMRLFITDQMPPGGGQPRIHGSITIHTDLDCSYAQAEQSVVGYALLAEGLRQFAERAKAEIEENK